MEVIIAALMFVATVVLVGVTAWYAYLTHRILHEVRKQGQLLAYSAAISVQAGITAMPGPGEYSAAQGHAYDRLTDLDKDVSSLLDSIRADLAKK